MNANFLCCRMHSIRLLILLTFILYEIQSANSTSIKPITFLKSLLLKHLPSSTEQPIPVDDAYSAPDCQSSEDDDAVPVWNEKSVFHVNGKPIIIDVQQLGPSKQERPIVEITPNEEVDILPKVDTSSEIIMTEGIDETPEKEIIQEVEKAVEIATVPAVEIITELGIVKTQEDNFDPNTSSGENTSKKQVKIDNIKNYKNAIHEKIHEKIKIIKAKVDKLKNSSIKPVVEIITEDVPIKDEIINITPKPLSNLRGPLAYLHGNLNIKPQEPQNLYYSPLYYHHLPQNVALLPLTHVRKHWYRPNIQYVPNRFYHNTLATKPLPFTYSVPDNGYSKYSTGLSNILHFIKSDIKPSSDPVLAENAKPCNQSPIINLKLIQPSTNIISSDISTTAKPAEQPETTNNPEPVPSRNPVSPSTWNTMRPIVVYPTDTDSLPPEYREQPESENNWDQGSGQGPVLISIGNPNEPLRGDIPVGEDYNSNKANNDQSEVPSYSPKERRQSDLKRTETPAVAANINLDTENKTKTKST